MTAAVFILFDGIYFIIMTSVSEKEATARRIAEETEEGFTDGIGQLEESELFNMHAGDSPSAEGESGEAGNVRTVRDYEYILVGAASGDERHAVAVLESIADGVQKVVKTGDVLPGLGEVTAIESERLLLESREGEALQLLTREAYRKRIAALSALSLKKRSIESNRWIISRSDVLSILARSDTLMRDVAVVPQYKGNRLIGFKITKMKPEGLIAGLGFHEDDVIISVNGRPLRGIEELYELQRSIGDASKLEIGFTRKGTDQTYIFEIQ